MYSGCVLCVCWDDPDCKMKIGQIVPQTALVCFKVETKQAWTHFAFASSFLRSTSCRFLQTKVWIGSPDLRGSLALPSRWESLCCVSGKQIQQPNTEGTAQPSVDKRCCSWIPGKGSHNTHGQHFLGACPNFPGSLTYCSSCLMSRLMLDQYDSDCSLWYVRSGDLWVGYHGFWKSTGWITGVEPIQICTQLTLFYLLTLFLSLTHTQSHTCFTPLHAQHNTVITNNHRYKLEKSNMVSWSYCVTLCLSGWPFAVNYHIKLKHQGWIWLI